MCDKCFPQNPFAPNCSRRRNEFLFCLRLRFGKFPFLFGNIGEGERRKQERGADTKIDASSVFLRADLSLPFLPHPILFFFVRWQGRASPIFFFLLRSDVGKEGRRERKNSAQFSLALMERARPCHAAKAKKASGKLPPPYFFLPARSITQINLLIGWLQQKRNWNEKKDSGNFSRVSQAEKFVFPATLSYSGGKGRPLD